MGAGRPAAETAATGPCCLTQGGAAQSIACRHHQPSTHRCPRPPRSAPGAAPPQWQCHRSTPACAQQQECSGLRLGLTARRRPTQAPEAGSRMVPQVAWPPSPAPHWARRGADARRCPCSSGGAGPHLVLVLHGGFEVVEHQDEHKQVVHCGAWMTGRGLGGERGLACQQTRRVAPPGHAQDGGQ